MSNHSTKITIVKVDVSDITTADLASIASSLEDYGYTNIATNFQKGVNAYGRPYQLGLFTCRRPIDKPMYLRKVWPIHIQWDPSNVVRKSENNTLAAECAMYETNGSNILFVDPSVYAKDIGDEDFDAYRRNHITKKLAKLLDMDMAYCGFNYDDQVITESGWALDVEDDTVFDSVN
jgi:hypothetical protein